MPGVYPFGGRIRTPLRRSALEQPDWWYYTVLICTRAIRLDCLNQESQMTNGNEWKPQSAVASAVYAAGFSYNADQDIIYSRMRARQRTFGYCYVYDCMAPLSISATIDCEPIFFSHDNRDWMIELWKGQYGVETGGEIGVYNRPPKPGRKYRVRDRTLGRRPYDSANGKFFDCAENVDRLKMKFTLRRNGEVLFERGPQKHWWLTGFRWGVLSKPEELSMAASITFPSNKMRTAFIGGLKKAGYSDYKLDGLTIDFEFAEAKAHQPRKDPLWSKVAAAAERVNQLLVEKYNKLGTPSNDPNELDIEFMIDYFTRYHTMSQHQYLATYMRNVGTPIADVRDSLRDIGAEKADELGQALSDAGYKVQEIAAAVGKVAEKIKPTPAKAKQRIERMIKSLGS